MTHNFDIIHTLQAVNSR